MSSDLPLGRVTRSILTFPWAISLLAAQQMGRMVAAPGDAVAAATRSLDQVTRATREPGRTRRDVARTLWATIAWFRPATRRR